jgi:hypothetical protein
MDASIDGTVHASGENVKFHRPLRKKSKGSDCADSWKLEPLYIKNTIRPTIPRGSGENWCL